MRQVVETSWFPRCQPILILQRLVYGIPQPASASRVLHDRCQCQSAVGHSCRKTQVHCLDDTLAHALPWATCLFKLTKCWHPSPGVQRHFLLIVFHNSSRIQQHGDSLMENAETWSLQIALLMTDLVSRDSFFLLCSMNSARFSSVVKLSWKMQRHGQFTQHVLLLLTDLVSRGSVFSLCSMNSARFSNMVTSSWKVQRRGHFT